MVKIFKTIKEFNSLQKKLEQVTAEVVSVKEELVKRDETIKVLSEEIKEIKDALEIVKNTQTLQSDFSAAWNEAINGFKENK